MFYKLNLAVKTISFIFIILTTNLANAVNNPVPSKPPVTKPGTIKSLDITIHGETDCSDGHQSATCGFGDNSGWNNSGNGGGPSNGGGNGGGNEGTTQLSAGDTRCAITSDGLKTVTSMSDEPLRALAANAVYRSLTLSGKMQANRVGYITVTYADGGTESWEVVAPLSTDALAKLPGTLSKADGVPKTKKC